MHGAGGSSGDASRLLPLPSRHHFRPHHLREAGVARQRRQLVAAVVTSARRRHQQDERAQREQVDGTRPEPLQVQVDVRRAQLVVRLAQKRAEHVGACVAARARVHEGAHAHARARARLSVEVARDVGARHLLHEELEAGSSVEVARRRVRVLQTLEQSESRLRRQVRRQACRGQHQHSSPTTRNGPKQCWITLIASQTDVSVQLNKALALESSRLKNVSKHNLD